VVVFVRDGRVAATDPHRELLRTSPEYRAIVTREPDAALVRSDDDAESRGESAYYAEESA
jgi:hypothetical protein